MKTSAIITTYNPNVRQLQQVVDIATKLFDEVILVDDCSDIVLPKFKRVRFYKNIRQMGFEDSRARGVMMAKNDIVVFLADDKPFDIQEKQRG